MATKTVEQPGMAPPQSQAIEALPPKRVFDALGTRPGGLTSTEATERLERYGANVLHEAHRTPLLRRLTANFTHVMAILLWIGGAVAFLSGSPTLGIAIWVVNIINGLFSFFQEFRAEKATEALRRLLPSYATVLRDGEEQQVLAEDLVPGDVLILSEGDRISADARLVKEAGLRVDQSTLTGESRPVRRSGQPAAVSSGARSEIPCLVFAGTSVASGSGKAVVIGTGMNTEFGKIADLTQGVVQTESPLQSELRRLSYVVSIIAVSMGVLFFILAEVFTPMDLATGFIFALGMIVAFVPEGLLPTVTLSLAMGTQRMAKRNALVKKLSAVETLGSTSVICTDKTGTLTQNEMTVRTIVTPSGTATVTGVGYVPDGQVTGKGVGPDLTLLLEAGSLANNARLIPPGDTWTIRGDPTEAAIKVAAAKAGVNLDDLERRRPRTFEFPFDSTRKRMTTLHTLEGRAVAYVKGAPKELLELCDRIRIDGVDAPLDDALRARMSKENDDLSKQGLRVLGIAYRPDLPKTRDVNEVEQHLVFLGLVGMMDPPRPEVADAVERCHRAGIRIIMITGDYGLTAESIARRIGLVEHPRILTGQDLAEMTDEELAAALDGEVLVARAAPEHKLRVVSVLQEAGAIVAVTGDGVNDAPALKKADIGVAMGLSGTDVAKEAADVILLDDNFASIVNAVEEGRAVFANIRRFTSYIFTSNTPEAIPFILFAFTGGRVPLALDVMPILAIDLGTDLVPALALGAEPPEPGVMDTPPRDPTEHLVTRSLLIRSYLWLGLLQASLVMAAFYGIYWTGGFAGQWLDLPASGPLHRSAVAMALTAVVATQIGNLWAQRSERTSVLHVGLLTNPLIWVGMATELLFLALFVYAPFFQRILGTAPFPAADWVWLLALIPPLLIVDEIRKALVRRRLRRKP